MKFLLFQKICSDINSAFSKIDNYERKEAEFKEKKKRGDFVDENHLKSAVEEVKKAAETAQKAASDIEKKKLKAETEQDFVVSQVIAHIVEKRTKQKPVKKQELI